MKIVRAESMRAMDQYAIRKAGIPSVVLMDRAAGGAAAAAEEMLGENPGRTVIFCGSGNNGGDGIDMACILTGKGCPVTCFMAGNPDRLSEDAAVMAKRYSDMGCRLLPWTPESEIPADCGLIVDALFGTGLSREIEGKYRILIETINRSGCPVLAVDIPSGISADTGEVLGIAVKADRTVTFQLPKLGQLIPPGTEYTGDLSVHDIGIPAEAELQVPAAAELVTEDLIAAHLPPQWRESHKGDYGKVLLLCGAKGYTGAPVLAAEGALRCGSGLVYLGVPDAIYPIAASMLREAVVAPMPCTESGAFDGTAEDVFASRTAGMDAVLAGPGIGRSPEAALMVSNLVRQCTCPMVIDADGIRALGPEPKLDGRIVLTPHDGEFAALTRPCGDRLADTAALSRRTGAVVLRKGYRTIVAAPDGRIYVNSTGNPGMAAGGSGDVLSGMILCLLGQGVEPALAAAMAAYLHGAAGDRCAARLGRRSMLPRDLLEELPAVLKEFERPLAVRVTEGEMQSC